jgi:hypothetical protein
MRQREQLCEVIKLGSVHPNAQAQFLEQWTKVAVWQSIHSVAAHRSGNWGIC